MNIICGFKMGTDIKLIYELLACQSDFCIIFDWTSKKKPTFTRGLLLIASLSICSHLMQRRFWKLKLSWEMYCAPVKAIELHEKNPPVFLLYYSPHKEGYACAKGERTTKSRQRRKLESGAETCKCIRQRMIHLLCTEKLAINFRFKSKSILLGKN